MISSFREARKAFELPQTPYQLRQVVLSELLIQVELALEQIAPMRRGVKDAPIPEELRKRIIDNEAAFYRARSQIKKWRDNPSQRFGGKMKEMAILLHKSCGEMWLLKDQSFHAGLKLGLRFFSRAGFVRNQYENAA